MSETITNIITTFVETYKLKSESSLKIKINLLEKFYPEHFENCYLINKKHVWNFDLDKEIYVFDEISVPINDMEAHYVNNYSYNYGKNFHVYIHPNLYDFNIHISNPVTGTNKCNIRVSEYCITKFNLIKNETVSLPNMYINMLRLSNLLFFYDEIRPTCIGPSNKLLGWCIPNIFNINIPHAFCKLNLTTFDLQNIDALAMIHPDYISTTLSKIDKNSGMRVRSNYISTMFKNDKKSDMCVIRYDEASFCCDADNLSGPLIISKQIAILIQKSHYLIYDLRNDKILERIQFRTAIKYHDTSPTVVEYTYITPIIRVIDDKIIIVDDIGSNVCILKNAAEIAKENECFICYHPTKKDACLVPCGHTQYCITCIKKSVTDKRCAICLQEVSTSVKIHK